MKQTPAEQLVVRTTSARSALAVIMQDLDDHLCKSPDEAAENWSLAELAQEITRQLCWIVIFLRDLDEEPALIAGATALETFTMNIEQGAKHAAAIFDNVDTIHRHHNPARVNWSFVSTMAHVDDELQAVRELVRPTPEA